MFLALTAELVGVTNLRPNDTEDNPYYYNFRVQCTSCREIHPNVETKPLPSSRGTANLIIKCKTCKRENSANIISPSATPYQQSDPPKRQNILEFECRGLEFVEFVPEGEWLCEGVETGSKFTGVELEEGEWYEYDVKNGEETTIKEVKWEIRRT